jgi:hypothetical protein
LIDASLPLFLAVEREARTTDDNIPMIAITTSNSINVKPPCEYFFIKNFIHYKTNNTLLPNDYNNVV